MLLSSGSSLLSSQVETTASPSRINWALKDSFSPVSTLEYTEKEKEYSAARGAVNTPERKTFSLLGVFKLVQSQYIWTWTNIRNVEINRYHKMRCNASTISVNTTNFCCCWRLVYLSAYTSPPTGVFKPNGKKSFYINTDTTRSCNSQNNHRGHFDHSYVIHIIFKYLENVLNIKHVMGFLNNRPTDRTWKYTFKNILRTGHGSAVWQPCTVCVYLRT